MCSFISFTIFMCHKQDFFGKETKTVIDIKFHFFLAKTDNTDEILQFI
jgi:hypothetical protein